MSSTAASLAVALALVAAPGQAKLMPCRDPTVELSTGLGSCTKGNPLNTECPVVLLPECDWMYPVRDYTAWGIPCGFGSAEACKVAPQNISWPSDDFSPAALAAVATFTDDVIRKDSPFREGLFAGDTELELRLTEPSKINVTFVDEGACHRNALGLMTWDGSINPRTMNWRQRKQVLLDGTLDVFLPNVDFEYCTCQMSDASWNEWCTEIRGPLQRGATMKLKPNFREEPDNFQFPADTTVSFFVIPDAFDMGLRPGFQYTSLVEDILFSTPMLNNPDFQRKTGGVDKSQHAVAFRGPASLPVDGATEDFSEHIFFAFEDTARAFGARASNEDYEDVVFFVDVEPKIPFYSPFPEAPEGPEAPVVPDGIPNFGVFPVSGDDSDGASPIIVPSSIRKPATITTVTPVLCQDGILSRCGNVCCAGTCGSCGGCDAECSAADGGAANCCPGTIVENSFPCLTSTDVGCVMNDAPCAKATIGDEGCL